MKNERCGLLEESHQCISVMAVTGIRSEYDLMYPLLNEMHNSPFLMYLWLSPVHTLPRFTITR